MGFSAPIPILRIFDVAKAREFYVDFLGYHVGFEHRFEPTAPLYMEVSRGDCRVHLSEHHGDACPGASIRVETDELDDLHRRLIASRYPYARPGLEVTEWGTREVVVRDPFGNKLVFFDRRVVP